MVQRIRKSLIRLSTNNGHYAHLWKEPNYSITIFPLDYTLVLLHWETLLASFVEIRGCTSLLDSHEIKNGWRTDKVLGIAFYCSYVYICCVQSAASFLNLCRNILIHIFRNFRNFLRWNTQPYTVTCILYVIFLFEEKEIQTTYFLFSKYFCCFVAIAFCTANLYKKWKRKLKFYCELEFKKDLVISWDFLNLSLISNIFC
jgi:hypothetical protein